MNTSAYKSKAAASIHETVSDLFDEGLVDKQTMKPFDEACLTPVQPMSPSEIREVRTKAGASQRVFAQYLNVSPGIVSQWERGEKQPSGACLKLLCLVKSRGLEAIA